ncbi:hemerythrin domain-containing protein [Shewanella insulae]|uniref:hemerythrin domain-containing protein n=1 Tax=Shewanella insulae TaxID=2681496 RepID=UPI001EFD7FE4|nr:hemerythrin domain-containing protein [Shewanella insulae]MCG9711339.1 hemerythrin domain-containing protein [Shewanella insulae]
MLARLHNDHKHIAILLNILKNKQQKLQNGEAVNFNLIRDIVEYMQSYAEHSHHPVEDLINEFYIQTHPQEALEKQLGEEHHSLIESSTNLMSTLNLILSDVPVQNETLSQALKEYVEAQRNHMMYEEAKLFPIWEAGMTEAQWQEVADRCKERLISDPLFSDDDNLLFEELKEYLVKAEE